MKAAPPHSLPHLFSTLSRQMCDRSGGNTFDCMSLTVQLSHTEHSRIYLMSRSSRLTAWLVKVHKYTDGNREACQPQTDIDVILRFITDPHYPLRLCSQPLVLTCHPGLKLIRILSEEKLKRVGDTLPDLPFIWCQENRFDVCTTKPDRVAWWRSSLYLPPTTSGPPSYSH